MAQKRIDDIISECIKKVISEKLNEHADVANQQSQPERQNEMLMEMARVGFVDGRVEVYVHTDDGGSIPHVHIRDIATRGREFETCVSLKESAYFLHGRYKDKMSNNMVKAFAEFMESPSRNAKYSSNYEYAVDMWNDNNSNTNISPQCDKNGNMTIPNYRKLND